MSLIRVNGVAFDHAGEGLLRDVSFAVEAGERWGVVGRNGSGKTTLFRLLVGELVPAQGSIARGPGLRVTMLDQHRDFGTARTVRAAAFSPFAELIALEQSLEAQTKGLERDASPAALARYDADLDHFDRLGGHTYRSRVEALLEGLGFDVARAGTQRLEELSGGERGRLGLLCQLAVPVDLVLLDEPTNHLDLETTRWLEEWLQTSRTTFMAISHDRAFLARVANRILHFEAGTAVPYACGYVDFVRLRAERRAAQQRAFELQQRQIAAEEEYIRRNIAGQSSRQAKGRRTRLERLPRLSPPAAEEPAMAVRLAATARGGDQVLVARDVRLEAGGRVLLDGFSARVTRGEVIGVVGPNGAGKSTLLRAITGEGPPASGEVALGAGVTFAHYRQDLAQVPQDRTLFDAIQALRPGWERGAVRSHLGRFGFSGDEVQRIAGSLSGGEQARLALAMIVLSGANLLLFDEPTNHLDVESVEALEDALEAYDGTVILVSHDRALLQALTTRIWAIHEGRIEDYSGTFDEWFDARDRRERQAKAQQLELAAERQRREKREHARRQQMQRQSASERRSRQQALERAEAEAHAAEGRVAELTERLQDPSLYERTDGVAEAYRLGEELRAAQAELDAALQAWADLEASLREEA